MGGRDLKLLVMDVMGWLRFGRNCKSSRIGLSYESLNKVH